MTLKCYQYHFNGTNSLIHLTMLAGMLTYSSGMICPSSRRLFTYLILLLNLVLQKTQDHQVIKCVKCAVKKRWYIEW